MDKNMKMTKAISNSLALSLDAPITWGKDDCLLWLADIYITALGYDPAAAYRGAYSSRTSAHRTLGARGVLGALHKTAKAYGWPCIAPGKAKLGDLGVIDTADGLAGVICTGAGWVGRLDYGFSMHQTARVRRAWSVS